jgi:hypothetical protein
VYLKAGMSLILEKQIDDKEFEIGGGGFVAVLFLAEHGRDPRKAEERAFALGPTFF